MDLAGRSGQVFKERIAPLFSNEPQRDKACHGPDHSPKSRDESKSKSGKVLYYGVCAIFFFIPVSVSPSSIAEGLVLAVWILSGRFVRDIAFIRQKWAWPIVVMMVLPWAGLLYSGDVATGLRFAEKTHYWLFSFVVAGVVSSGFNADNFLKFFIAGVSFTSLVFLGQLAGIIYRPNQYWAGVFGNWAHIELSLLTTFSIVLLSFLFAKAKKAKTKRLCLGLMLLQSAALAFLLTDSGHLAFILLTPVIAYNLLSGKRKNLKWAFVASVLMVGALLLSPVVQGRLKEVIHDTRDYAKGRILTPLGFHYYMWEGAIRIFAGHPLIGAGTGGYAYFMNKMRKPGIPRVVHPQNTVLYMASSYGIAGVILLISLWALPLGAGWRRRDSLQGFALLVFMAVLSVGSLTDTQIMSHQSGMLFAIFCGIALAIPKRSPDNVIPRRPAE